MDLWRKERIQSVLYKAVKQEDVEMAAKCLKMGAVDVNTRYEPVRSFITRNSNVAVRIRMSKYVYCLIFNFISICKDDSDYLAFKETTWSYSKFVYRSTFLCKPVPQRSQPIQICCMTITNMQMELRYVHL